MRTESLRPPVPVAALAAAVAVLLLAGVAVAVARAGGDDGATTAASGSTTTSPAPPPAEPAPAPPGVLPSRPTSIVAQAIVPAVAVYALPGAPQPQESLANPQASGAPLVFLVRQQQPEWLEVLLPVGPSGAAGWIRRSDVSLTQHDYAIVVELGAHRVTVFKSGQPLLEEPVAVGVTDVPAPGDLYYLKELLQPPVPGGVYGAYAYGLSGFSNVLTSFQGGEGVTGLHGTNDPDALGKDVESGSIAMSDAGISLLARTLPLGVPVDIRP